MDVNACVKSIIISVSHFCQNQSESNASQLLRHVEVLCALLKANNIAELFNSNNSLGSEFLKSVLRVIIYHNQDANLVNKMFKILNVIAGETLSCKYMYQSFNLCSVLCNYVVQHYSDLSRSDNVSQCFKLFEKVTYGQKISPLMKNIDKFVTCIFEEIEKRGNCFIVCLEIIVNLVTNNVAVQAQVKGIMDSMKIRKKLMGYLKSNDNRIKLNILAFLCICCWDDDVTQKMWSDFGNITNTFSLILPELFDLSNSHGLSNRRAVDLCLELLKHDDVAQPFAIYESEKNITLKLLDMLENKSALKSSEKIFEVLLAFSRIGFIRRNISENVLKNQGKMEVLLQYAASPVTRNTGPSSLLALDFIQEICEEIIDSAQDIKNTSWLSSILNVMFNQLTPEVADDIPAMSEIYLEIATERILKSLQILTVLANDDDIRHVVAAGLDVTTLNQVIQHQLTHNLTGISHSSQPRWSDVGVDVVLSVLQLIDKLKSDLPDLEKLLYTTLQDSRLVPIMATAMSSRDHKRVYAALRLHQEALPLPEYPSLLLAETIATSNDKKTPIEMSEYSRCDVSSIPQPTKNKRSLINSSVCSLSSDEDKENIQSLINKIHSIDEVQSDETKSGKTSEMFDIYEQKISSLITKENHLQDLLEAKTLALAQADRLIAQSRAQKSRSEEDMRRIVNMLKQAEFKHEAMCEKMKVLESDCKLQDREMQILMQKDEDLKLISDQYESILPDYNDKKHKISVLERNLKASHQEYESLKEFHEMIQKHNDKLKIKLHEATEKIELLEEERIEHLKKISDLERRGSDLAQLVEKQDHSYKTLAQDKKDQDVNVKNLNLHLKKKDEELKIKGIAFEKLKKEHEHKMKKHEVEKEDMLKLMEERQQEVEQKRQKLTQTLAMINDLSNNLKGSQSY